MIKKILVCAVLSVGICLNSVAAPINTITITKDVITAALKDPWHNYLNYRIEGFCSWLHFGMFGPYVTTTLKVTEFLPDAVVSVYTHNGSNPWVYANQFVDPVMQKVGEVTAKAIDGTAPISSDYSGDSGGGSMQQFKEVDIIGNPALSVFFSKLPFVFIPSNATALEPYYSSLSDSYLWHSPMMDDITHFKDLVPGIRTEGSSVDQWGAIFPRVGYINQLGDYKAAAVIALRGADIATNSDQGHIYHSLHSGSCGSHCKVWPSKENHFDDVKYQEIYPEATTDAKKVFGNNDLISGTYGQKQFSEGKGNYMWIMWRHYEGCIQGGGKFIGET